MRTPREKASVFSLRWPERRYSGAMYGSVPTILLVVAWVLVLVRSWPSLLRLSSRIEPKSATLAMDASSRAEGRPPSPKKDRVDLILMDCSMPTMDGFMATAIIRWLEAAKAAAAPKSRVPIVALTAYALTSDRDKCLEAGMDDYLTKPYSYAELEARLGVARLEAQRRYARASRPSRTPSPQPTSHTESGVGDAAARPCMIASSA